jgi:hypothetical protein
MCYGALCLKDADVNQKAVCKLEYAGVSMSLAIKNFAHECRFDGMRYV